VNMETKLQKFLSEGTKNSEESLELMELLTGGKSTFGQMVNAHRKCDSMTQQALADKVGVAKSYISQIENGTAPKNADIAKKIAQAFGVSEHLFIELALQEEVNQNGN